MSEIKLSYIEQLRNPLWKNRISLAQYKIKSYICKRNIKNRKQ